MNYPAFISIVIIIFIAFIFIFFLKKRNKVKAYKKANVNVVDGLSCLFENDENIAIEKLKAIVLKGNASAEIYLILGFLYRNRGEFNRASQIHEMILGKGGINKDFKNALIGELAEDYMLQGEFNKAISLLKSKSNLLHNPKNIITLTKCYLYSKNYDNALSYHEKYNKITGKELANFFEKCMVEKAVSSGNSNASLKYLKSALEKNIKCRPARIMKGFIYLNTGKIEKAINEFQEIIKEGLIRDIKDIKNIEKAFTKAGKESEFIKILRNEVSLKTINPFIHIALAEFYEYNHEKEASKTILETYLALPDSKIIAGKIYATKFNNKLLLRALKDVYSFKCRECGFELDEYRDDCPKCSAYDSIYPK